AGAAGADTAWIFEQIERLGDLHAKGLLTDEEFSAKKAELLDRI
ncbi:SHOCT domain-containing protein, partial [Nocardiopsis metallicus]